MFTPPINKEISNGMGFIFSYVSAFVPKLLILADVPESSPAFLKIHIPKSYI